MMTDYIRNTVRRTCVSVPLMLLSAIAFARDQVEMADKLRSSGKIYVVVAVICVVFTGLVFYLIAQDRRLRKLEELIKEKEKK